MAESVLQNCKGVEEYPFPHINIPSALSQEYYDELYNSLPNWQAVAGKQRGDNQRVSHYTDDMRKYSSAWQEFIRYHTSNEFYQEFVYWFGPFIREYLPMVEKKFGRLEDIPLKEIKGKAKGSWGILGSHVLLGVYTPTSRPTIARDAHLDKRDHLSSGLLYMADPDDNAKGPLQLFECDGKPIHGKFTAGEMCIKGKNVEFPHMKPVADVPYEANRFATFLCTQKSVHRVGLREATKYPRRFAGVSLIFSDEIREDL